MFTSQKITKGEIICNYDGEVCIYKQLQKRKKEYMLCGAYILEFKFQEKLWRINATKVDCSLG